MKVSNKARTKDAIKTVLLNLWMGTLLNRPTRYSRNRNDYKSGRRYGRLFMKYDRLIPVINTLVYLGYIKQKKGFLVHDKEFGYQTRMWATNALIQRFEDAGLIDYGFFTGDKPKDPIILKDSQKRKIQYVDDRKTNKMRAQVKQYNSCINGSVVTVVLDGIATVTMRFLLQFLYQHTIKGAVRIVTVNLINQNHIPYHNKYYPNTNSIYYHNTLSTMTKREHWRHLPVVSLPEFMEAMMIHNYLADVNAIVRAFESFEDANEFLNQTVVLQDIGIEHLEIQLVHEHLHRVFNDGSFSRGGRFYGALHLSLPRDLRPFIHIDGQPIVELDFCGLHINMLYHMAGIDYQGYPYRNCEGKDMEGHYKAVGLISINAENEKKAYGAIKDELKKRGLKAPDRKRPIASLVDIFKQAHKPIQRHLFSGIGTTLQNIDSDIMNAILARLVDKGIDSLPVHDSIIVPAQHKDTLRSLMIDEYQKRMGIVLSHGDAFISDGKTPDVPEQSNAGEGGAHG